MEERDLQKVIEDLTWVKPQTKDWYYWDFGKISLVDGKNKKDKPDARKTIFLCEKEVLTNGVSYRPLEDSTLFWRFASIPCTNAALIEWTNKYGRLTPFNFIKNSYTGGGGKTRINITSYIWAYLRLSSISEETVHLPETMAFYQNEHITLKYAAYLWESIATKNKDMLSRVFEIDGMRTNMMFNTKIFSETIEAEGKSDYEIVLSWNQVNEARKENNIPGEVRFIDDDFEIARKILKEIINDALVKHPINTVLDHNKAALVLRPSGLLSCMWYQLALAFKERIKLRRCAICGQWEDMKDHRENWTKHKQCANNEAVKRYRKKKGIA